MRQNRRASACRGRGVAAMECGGAPVERGLSRSHFPRSSAHVRVCHRSFARPITAAAGVYAPGHIGELTQYLPFELVDDVLSETKTVQRRLRVLPSRVGVYFVLALVLFPRLGYARVWQKLTAGLVGLDLPSPSEKALRDLRRRLGPAPFKALFEVVAGPLGQPHTPGVCYRGMRTVAFDGCNSLKVPDTERNRTWLGRIRYRMGFAGYPTLRMMTLIETGTRAMIGAVLGSAADRDEATLARRLLPLLHPNMVVLLDRAFDATAFLQELNQTGAHFLVRSKSTRRPPVLTHLPDGSYLSDLDGLTVRIIDAELTVTGADDSRVSRPLPVDHHPARPLTTIRRPSWSGSTTNAGRSRSPTWRCGTPSSTDTCCAPRTGPVSNRRSGPC